MNNFQVARIFLKSPSRAFLALKEWPVFLLPMCLAMFAAAVAAAWYYSIIDLSWLQDQTFSAAHVRATARQIAGAPRARPVVLWIGALGTPVSYLTFAALAALYFLVAGSLTNVRYSFRHWFAFVWWVATPLIVACIPTLLILTLSTTRQIPPNALQPLSLNEIVFHRGMAEAGYNLLSNVGFVQLAQVWLAYLGLRAWSGRSATYCLVVVSLPFVCIYGVWAVFSFR